MEGMFKRLDHKVNNEQQPFLLKLAEIELIHSEIGEYPILLFDDVLSELDDYRQSHLLNTIQGRFKPLSPQQALKELIIKH